LVGDGSTEKTFYDDSNSDNNWNYEKVESDNNDNFIDKDNIDGSNKYKKRKDGLPLVSNVRSLS
jgi:hypothetical protein